MFQSIIFVNESRLAGARIRRRTRQFQSNGRDLSDFKTHHMKTTCDRGKNMSQPFSLSLFMTFLFLSSSLSPTSSNSVFSSRPPYPSPNRSKLKRRLTDVHALKYICFCIWVRTVGGGEHSMRLNARRIITYK